MKPRCWIRWTYVATMIVASLPSAGCSAGGERPLSRFLPLGRSAREEAMRPYVESGSFPTAKQAGVKSHAD